MAGREGRVTVEFGEGARAVLRQQLGNDGAADAAAWVRKAARAALRAQDALHGDVTLVLLGDAAIAELNQRYLAHEGSTDVLSFPLSAEGETPSGEVYIGVEQATRQAVGLNVTLREELTRLAVHGTLHVLGHDHPEGDEREQSAMWALQERIVSEVMSR
jgi:probable rRNA maturation factor